jgi:mono/diheme cytochrome c family protein
MNRCIAVLSATTLLAGASVGLTQENSCLSKSSKRDAYVYAELARAPEKALSKRNPLEQNPNAAAAGRLLFERHCSECHGYDAQGGKKGPSLRATEVQSAAPGAIFWILTNGVVRRGMPFGFKLPEPQRGQLVTDIKSLGSAAPVPANSGLEKSPPSPTDPLLPRH